MDSTTGTTPPAPEDKGQAGGQDFKVLYEGMQAKLQSGELVAEAVSKLISSGELYPKDRFTGLQKSLNEAVETRKALASDLATAQAAIDALKGEKATLEGSYQELNTKVVDASTRLTQHEKRIARKDLLLKSFPHLAGFEADGLLPDGEVDQLPTLFQAFSDRVSGIQKQADANKSAGGTPTPPAPGGEGKRSSQEMLKLVQNASLGDTSAGSYEDLYAEYQRTLASEKKPVT